MIDRHTGGGYRMNRLRTGINAMDGGIGQRLGNGSTGLTPWTARHIQNRVNIVVAGVVVAMVEIRIRIRKWIGIAVVLLHVP